MRTLTAPATLVTGRAYAEPVLLVTMTTTSGQVFRFSDYDRVIGGVEYSGLIQNPQDLTEALNDFDGGGAPATAQVTLFNDRPIGGKARFSDLIQTARNLTGTYDFTSARVDIDRLEQGQALADAVRLQSFYLETPSAIGDSLITLQMSDLSQVLEDALPVTKISKALFPAAPASVLEQEIRRPFGTIKNVKALPIQDGAASTLSADITDTATSITLTDAADFPAMGTGMIEEEFVTWTSKSSNTLTGVTRAAQSSTADAHASGTTFFHVRTDAYVFVVGEGATSPSTEGVDLIANGTFATDVAGWGGSGTWDAGNGGQAKLAQAGLQNLVQTKTVVAGTTYTIRLTIRTSTIRLFVSDAAAGAGTVLYDVENVPGDYAIRLVSATTTMYCNFVNGNDADAFLDSVSLKPLGTSMPLTAITNIRVNGRAARTSPTTSLANTALVPDHVFGTITFTPSNVKFFHTLPQGQAEVILPAGHSINVIGDGATNVAGTSVLTPTTGVAEVGTRTRRTISWSIATTTAFTDANFWHLGRYLTSRGIGTLVQIGVGQGTAGNITGNSWGGSHTIEYPSDGSETIVFTSLLGSAKTITLTFTEITITYPDGAGGSGSTSAAVIGDVTCDVQGIADDALGSFSGVASQLLENPTDIAKLILQVLYRRGSSEFDSTWATTRAIHASAGYKWAGLLGFKQFSEIRRMLSEQARGRLVLTSGRIGLRWRAYRPAADVTFEYDPTAGRTGVAQELAVKLTSPTEKVNGLTVRYAYQDSRGEYLSSFVVGDPVAAAALPPMELALVADEHTARDLAAYWYGLKRRQRFAVDGIAWHNALALEQGDHFAINGHPVLTAHGDEALIFSIQRKTDRGGRDGMGQIALGGLEDTIDGDVGPEDTSMAWGSRGLQAKNNAATPLAKIDVTAAAVVLRNSSNLVVVRHNPGSITLDTSLAGPIANGRDVAGVHSASSWIHVYWIWDATNGLLALTSSAVAPPTGPTLPTNYTYWAYVGAYYYNASSQLIRTTICGSWASRQNVEALAAAVTDAAEHSIDGTAIWPPNAMRIGGSWGAVLSVAGDSADLRAETGVDSGPHLETPGATTTGFGGGFRMNVTGQTIWYIQSAAASRVWRLEINEYELPNGGA